MSILAGYMDEIAVLVLNYTYEPLHFTNAKRAIILVSDGEPNPVSLKPAAITAADNAHACTRALVEFLDSFDDIAERARFAVEVLRELRRQVGPSFPIIWRFSQWKLHDYDAKPWPTPAALEAFLRPLVEAGVDVFHASTRRFWLPEFDGSRLNLAGWTKKITGLPTITVGSVTLTDQLLSSSPDPEVATTGLDELLERLGSGEFDLVAIGRALIANPDWPTIVRSGAVDRLRPYNQDALQSLV